MLGRCWASQPNDRPSVEDVLQCLGIVSDSSEPSSPGVDEDIDGDDDGWNTDTSSSSGDSLDLFATDDRVQLPPIHSSRDLPPTNGLAGQGPMSSVGQQSDFPNDNDPRLQYSYPAPQQVPQHHSYRDPSTSYSSGGHTSPPINVSGNHAGQGPLFSVGRRSAFPGDDDPRLQYSYPAPQQVPQHHSYRDPSLLYSSITRALPPINVSEGHSRDERWLPNHYGGTSAANRVHEVAPPPITSYPTTPFQYPPQPPSRQPSPYLLRSVPPPPPRQLLRKPRRTQATSQPTEPHRSQTIPPPPVAAGPANGHHMGQHQVTGHHSQYPYSPLGLGHRSAAIIDDDAWRGPTPYSERRRVGRAKPPKRNIDL